MKECSTDKEEKLRLPDWRVDDYKLDSEGIVNSNSQFTAAVLPVGR